jgi:hypothetical protein
MGSRVVREREERMEDEDEDGDERGGVDGCLRGQQGSGEP